jgi:4-amino-4-deoxy-L-arabinose transferase-like glycosyltransferase
MTSKKVAVETYSPERGRGELRPTGEGNGHSDLRGERAKTGNSGSAVSELRTESSRAGWPAFLDSKRVIWIVLGLAFLLRGGLALRTPNSNMEWDANSYRTIAHRLASGEGYTLTGVQPDTYWAPFAPLLIAAVYLLKGGDLVVREVWAVVGTCLVLAVYALARVKHGLPVSNLAAMAAALYPYNIIVGTSTSTEIPNNLLLLLVILNYVMWRHRHELRFAFLAGLALGLATLNRPAGIVFLPVMALFFFLDHSGASRRSSISAAAVFLLAASFLVSPWVVRTSRIAGSFSMVTSGGPWNLWFGNNAWLQDYMTGKIDIDALKVHLNSVVPPGERTQRELDRAYLHGLQEFVSSEPLSEVRLLAFKTVQFWQIPGITSTATHASVKPFHWVILLVGFLSYVPLVILGLVSTTYMVLKRQIREIRIYLIWMFITYVSYVWFPAVNRFRFAGAIDNLMIILCFAPISILWRERSQDAGLVPVSES